MSQASFELRLVNGSDSTEGRVEIRHHGIWGTVCDDDFSNANAKVICNSLGYGGQAIVKKNGYYGPGKGPIWLDEVSDLQCFFFFNNIFTLSSVVICLFMFLS